MKFIPIEKSTWVRKEHFEHYFSNIPCTYSLTANLDITGIKRKDHKLYSVMLYLISKVANQHAEFRTALNGEGVLGIFDIINPSYTVFHNDTETFSIIWTEYNDDYDVFKKSYEADLKVYGKICRLFAKPDEPANCFPVSMIPWSSFAGFNLNLQKGFDYLFPIFTMGKYFQSGSTVFLPLSIQVHHAVCDGFHVSRFINELQQLTSQWDI